MWNSKVMWSCLLLAALTIELTAAAAGPSFLLYTRRNWDEAQRVEPEVEYLMRSSFYAAEPIVLLLPQWQGNATAERELALIETLLQREACNVFAVQLEAATSEVQIVAAVRDLLLLLRQQFEVPLQRQQLIGYAEGAHLAAAAAAQVQQALHEQVARITALDPSQENVELQHKLSSQDAQFVEVIHTSNSSEQLGDADFYPNGGELQPGCTTAVCAQQRALELAIEMWSPGNEFIIANCGALQSMSASNCRWSTQRMGVTAKQGIYFLETHSSAPFGRGAYHIAFL
ncbi:CG10116 [Drosophila busckii]|uniref:CG10116 n=1 Tax=Drosophila busckii TaxID=30019 RepID=A0A0M4EAG9_DROBS|nr:pancreatic lipase-related protein 3 [Drosophila busckii]ALC44254.1 CG10116 [Drosophila busckii]